MILGSLVNSGESFEKCVGLVDCAYKTDANFYLKYDKVYVFYSDNLQKHNNQKVTGSLKSFMEFCNMYKINFKSYKKIEILEKLLKLKYISFNTYKRCIKNNEVYKKIINNIPWHVIYKNVKNKILNFMKTKYPNVEFVYINQKISLNEIYENLPLFQRVAKIYFMDKGGCISSKSIGKADINMNKIEKNFKRSAIQAYNVFLFINAICTYLKNRKINFLIGYRPASRYIRKSYDMAIEYINNNFSSIIEPSNARYNEKYSLFSEVSIEDKNSAVVYKAFFDILKELNMNCNM